VIVRPGGPPGGAETHFALMDKVYRHQRHFYDFTRKYYLLGRDRLIRELGVRPAQSVVEIGCGTARNLIRIARAYPGALLYGVDASAEMLRSASASVARHKLKPRIHLAAGLAESVTPALFKLSAPFDHIIFSYSLSMIPDWRGALGAALGALAPDGHIHIVDFGDLKGINPLFANGLLAWLRFFHVTPRGEFLSHLEAAATRGKIGNLTVLSGRYAFLWHGTRDGLQILAESPVAGPPQVTRNS